MGTFSAASPTRFSPKWRTPSSQAAWMWATVNILVTATKVISAGSRPARPAASAILCSKSRKLASISTIAQPLIPSTTANRPVRPSSAR